MPPSTPHIIILGQSGFSGAALSRRFAEDLGCRVTGFSSKPLDLCSPDSFKDLAAHLTPDSIVVVSSRSRAVDPYRLLTQDQMIAQNVAKAITLTPVKKCVYFSTVSVYDDTVTNFAISEQTPVNPASLYGAGKFAAERLLAIAASRWNIPCLILRPCKIFGPGDRSGLYGPASFCQAFKRNEELTLYGDGLELRDHLFIKDLEVVVSSMALADCQGIFNLASGESRSFQDIIGILAEISGKKPRIATAPRNRQAIDQKFDITKLCRAMPGYRFTPLAQSLELLYRAPAPEEIPQPGA